MKFLIKLTLCMVLSIFLFHSLPMKNANAGLALMAVLDLEKKITGKKSEQYTLTFWKEYKEGFKENPIFMGLLFPCLVLAAEDYTSKITEDFLSDNGYEASEIKIIMYDMREVLKAMEKKNLRFVHDSEKTRKHIGRDLKRLYPKVSNLFVEVVEDL